MSDDSISRQAVVDLVEELETQRLKGDIDLLYAPMIKGVRALPSAQPETHDKRTKRHACDCISRQSAIDALKSLEFRQYMEFGEYIGEDIREVCLIRAEKAQDALQSLPSAQPEPEEDCDTCKHGYFGDSQCNNCRVRFPSHYEREEEYHGSD